MADIIRVKGKTSQTSIDNIQLKGRELLYDGDESVYIGTTSGEDAAKDKKKLYGKQLTDLADADSELQKGLNAEIDRATKAEKAANTYTDGEVSSLKTKITNGDVVAANATNATNVTSKINSVAITRIFEEDKTTVKRASAANSLWNLSAGTALELDGKSLLWSTGGTGIVKAQLAKSSETVGSTNVPVYLNNGTLTECNLTSSLPPVGSLWWGKEGDTPPYNGMTDPATGSTVVWSEVGYTPLNIKGTVYKQNVAMDLTGTQDNQTGRITVPVDDTCFFKTFPSTTQLVAEVLTKEYILNTGTTDLSLSDDSTKLTIKVSNATKNPAAGLNMAKMSFKISATSSSTRQVDLHCYWRAQ